MHATKRFLLPTKGTTAPSYLGNQVVGLEFLLAIGSGKEAAVVFKLSMMMKAPAKWASLNLKFPGSLEALVGHARGLAPAEILIETTALNQLFYLVDAPESRPFEIFDAQPCSPVSFQ